MYISKGLFIPYLGYHLALMNWTNPRDAAARSARTIPIRSRGPLVLVADLGTLSIGEQEFRARLSAQLRRRPHTSIIYAAPAHGVTSAQACISMLGLPTPDVLVGDRGASVQAARPHVQLEILDAAIEKVWPGSDRVRTRVEALEHIVDEHQREDARRITFFPQPSVSIEDAQFAVGKVLHDLDVKVQVSDNQKIDVLPPGTDLAMTLNRTLRALRADPSWVVMAGAFVEPRLFHQPGYWGVATGDAPAPVRSSLSSHPRVHVTATRGPAGVLEGLQTLGFIVQPD